LDNQVPALKPPVRRVLAAERLEGSLFRAQDRVKDGASRRRSAVARRAILDAVLSLGITLRQAIDAPLSFGGGRTRRKLDRKRSQA
jgi:hypothetical protein